MGKLGKREIVVVDDEGVEEVKNEEPSSDKEVVDLTEETPSKKKLSDKQKESLRIGREKNRKQKQEKKNAKEVSKLRTLIMEELERRDQEMATVKEKVECGFVVLFICISLLVVFQFNFLTSFSPDNIPETLRGGQLSTIYPTPTKEE